MKGSIWMSSQLKMCNFSHSGTTQHSMKMVFELIGAPNVEKTVSGKVNIYRLCFSSDMQKYTTSFECSTFSGSVWKLVCKNFLAIKTKINRDRDNLTNVAAVKNSRVKILGTVASEQIELTQPASQPQSCTHFTDQPILCNSIQMDLLLGIQVELH